MINISIVLIRHASSIDFIECPVEPEDRGDWALAAARRCNAVLSPRQCSRDFILLPLLTEPATSETEKGRVKFAVFALRYITDLKNDGFENLSFEDVERAIGGFECVPKAVLV